MFVRANLGALLPNPAYSLERPCMEHLPFIFSLQTQAAAAQQVPIPTGHALMASCPPEPFTALTPDRPFGYSRAVRTPAAVTAPTPTSGGVDGPEKLAQPPVQQQGTWELSKGELSKLLDLSKKLDLDGEITPIMAWGMVARHPRLSELAPVDFLRLTEELSRKVRCYG